MGGEIFILQVVLLVKRGVMGVDFLYGEADLCLDLRRAVVVVFGDSRLNLR